MSVVSRRPPAEGRGEAANGGFFRRQLTARSDE